MSFENVEWKLIAKDEATRTLKQVNDAQSELEQTTRASNATTQRSSALFSQYKVAMFAAGAAIVAAGGFAFKEAASFELLEKRFKVLLGSTEKAKERLEELNQFALATPFQTDEVAKASTILQTFGGDALATGEGLRFVGDMAAFAQQPIDQIAIHAGRAIDALQSGRPFGESAQRMQELGLISGESRAKLESFQGQTMTAAEAMAILQGSVTNVSGTMEEMNNTVTGQLSNVEQQFRTKMREIGQHIFEAFDVKDTLRNFADVINKIDVTPLVSIIKRLVETFKDMGKDVSDMVGRLRGVIDEEVAGKIKNVLSSIAKFVGTTFVGTWKAAIAAVEVIVTSFAKVMDLWGDEIASVFDFFTRVIGTALKIVTELFKGISALIRGDFSGAWVSFANVIARVWNSIVSFTETAVNLMIRGLRALLDPLNLIGKAAEKLGVDIAVNLDFIKFDFVNLESTIGEVSGSISSDTGDMSDSVISAAAKASLGMDGMAKSSGGAAKSANKMSEEMQKLGEKYNDAVNNAEESMAKLALAHAEKTDDIKGKITELLGKLDDLKTKYADTMNSLDKSEATGVVDQEKKIADLRARIEEEKKKISEQKDGNQDNSRLVSLESQLKQEESVYQNYISTRQGLDDQLTEARRRANLTDFERFIEDINTRRTEAETSHQRDLEMISTQIAEQEAAFAREKEVFDAKRAEYLKTQEQFQIFRDSYVDNLTNMKQNTEVTVNQMNQKLQEIVSIVGQIEKAKAQAGIGGVSALQFSQENGGSVAQASGGNTNVYNFGDILLSDASESSVQSFIEKIKRELELAQVGAST